ncbi:MAG: hypothetical protein AAB774_01850 [Patescibacteria group bacterium]
MRMNNRGNEKSVIRLIHRNLIFAVVATVIIGALVFANLYRGGLLGPIVGDRNIFSLYWRISDHTATSILTNDLKGSDEPEYIVNKVMPLERNSDGGLKALPRFQGQLEYCSKTTPC